MILGVIIGYVGTSILGWICEYGTDDAHWKRNTPCKVSFDMTDYIRRFQISDCTVISRTSECCCIVTSIVDSRFDNVGIEMSSS